MKALWACFAIMFWLVVPLAHASLVHIDSIYPDDSVYPRQVKVEGSGLLFSYGQRFFVFTAAHLSQGRNLAIQLGSRNLNIVNHASDEKNDLALFEISGLSQADVKAHFSDGQIVFNCTQIHRQRWVDSYNFVAIDNWIDDPNLESDNELARLRPRAVGLDLFAHLLQAPTLVQPGASGSPLLTRRPSPGSWSLSAAPYDMREGFEQVSSNACLVRGLALQRERFFSLTQFVPIRQMLPLLQRYLARQSSSTNSHWHASGAILYRVMDGYTAAASLSASYAGAQVSVIGDHAPVVGGDLKSIGENSPRDFLQAASRLALQANPQLHWSVDIAQELLSSAMEFNAWFDMNLYPHLKKPGASKIFAENQPTNFISILRQRLSRSEDVEVLEPAYLRINNNSILMRIAVEEGDELRLQLNRYGALCIDDTCQARFQPVVEAISRKGKSYIVDLRELFFVQPGSTEVLALNEPASALLSQAQVADRMREALESEFHKPRIAYRRKTPPQPGPMSLEQGLRTVIQWSESVN